MTILVKRILQNLDILSKLPMKYAFIEFKTKKYKNEEVWMTFVKNVTKYSECREEKHNTFIDFDTIDC